MDKDLPDLPFPPAVENIPRTLRSMKSEEGRGLLKRVGSMLTPRKKPNLVVCSALHHNPVRPSYDSNISTGSRESEAEIRCPSGLGSAVSIISFPSCSPTIDVFGPINSPPLIKRAISTPNLLRSLSQRVKQIRRPSIITNKISTEHFKRHAHSSVVALPSLVAAKAGPCLPEEVISLILSHLPRSAVASCATISKAFTPPTRYVLYGRVDIGSLPLTQLENLLAVLSSRSHLAELVTIFICNEWPSFFITDTKSRSGVAIQHREALLTATFTLALERMSNLTSLTLPAFDASLVAHHTSFGLKSITFLNYTMTEAETKALFAWLDGQVNITALQFPNLVEIAGSSGKPLTVKTNIPNKDDIESELAISLHNPHFKTFPSKSSAKNRIMSFYFPSTESSPSSHTSSVMQSKQLFSSPTLLPNLATLHATPDLVRLLSSPLDDASSSRRPLKSISLNINTTLYNGLRPAALMSSLRGITHLGLVFSANVDRRSFEKVIGAAGASLGSFGDENSDDPFIIVQSPTGPRGGLRILEITFQTSQGQPGRDEVRLFLISPFAQLHSFHFFFSQAVYKSLQASLPRYNALSSLKLVVKNAGQRHKPETAELDLINSWIKACPTLNSVILFSGAEWTRRQEHS